MFQGLHGLITGYMCIEALLPYRLHLPIKINPFFPDPVHASIHGINEMEQHDIYNNT